MKTVKLFFKILAVLFAIVLVVVFLPFMIGFIDFGPTVDAYRINNAEFEETTFNELATRQQVSDGEATRPQFPVTYHAIKAGKGTVLAVRSFHDPSIGFDDEVFWKLTIWMPSYKEGVYDLTKQNDIIVFFTRGGSAWPDKMCAGELKLGTLTVEQNRISVNSTLHCEKRNKDFEVKGSWKLSELDVKNLDYWIGKKGASYTYEETYYRGTLHKILSWFFEKFFGKDT
ncbi:hypothetical protein [Bdellovibrio sp. HCB-162]|uniref:hypothetical protein n=1 Tax=Bdellovibrio sp. HCB-162 TaxID=3394234 RepID=UPI0039BD722F